MPWTDDDPIADQPGSAKPPNLAVPNRLQASPKAPRRPPLGEAVLRIELDRRRDARPFFEQIRSHVRQAVADGQLGPGFRLPPERQLAAALEVSRSTVTRAYQELVADGLVRAAPSRGTVVLPVDQGRPPGANGPAAAPEGNWMLALPPLTALGSDAGLLREIFGGAGRAGVVSFATSAPPEDLIPVAQLAACVRQAFEEQGAKLLGYGPVDGLPELREIIADRLRSAGATAAGDSVIVLSGSTQGLALAARVLVEPGDAVVVEEPTYIGTIQTFELAGARLIGVPVDANGIRADSLEGILSRRQVRLMVLQPNFHNPTGASLSQPRREHVLWLARRYGVPILEDDAYGALHHDPVAPGSLKQLDRHGLVIYLSTFSKTLAPGLRVAWMCAPEPVIGRIGLAKQLSDLNTNTLGQAIVARMVSGGAYDANLERLRAASRERMGLLLGELDRMSDVLERDLDPRGGLHVWCRLRVGDAQIAAAAAARSGIAVVAGTAFYPSGAQGAAGRDRIRLSLPISGKDSIRAGARRLHEALRQLPVRVDQGSSRRMTVVV
jgi:DNA-binding transcriptional MocR family regulator